MSSGIGVHDCDKTWLHSFSHGYICRYLYFYLGVVGSVLVTNL